MATTKQALETALTAAPSGSLVVAPQGANVIAFSETLANDADKVDLRVTFSFAKPIDEAAQKKAALQAVEDIFDAITAA